MPLDNPRVRVGAMAYRICGSRKKNGQPCKLPAGYKTDHPGYGSCALHWGCTVANRKSAAIQEVRERMLVKLGDQHPTITPEDALLQEVRRAAASVAWFDEQVNGITPEALDDDETGYKRAALITVWRQERRHMADVAALALRAGIEERMVRATEAQAEGVVRALMSVVRELGLTDEQQLDARRKLAGHLRELDRAS
jgi:hypothetical protein